MYLDCVACCFVSVFTGYSWLLIIGFGFIVDVGCYAFSCFDCACLLLIVVMCAYWCFGFGLGWIWR